MRLAAGLHPDMQGSCSVPPDSQAVIRGEKGGKGKERVGNSREWKEGEGMKE